MLSPESAGTPLIISLSCSPKLFDDLGNAKSSDSILISSPESATTPSSIISLPRSPILFDEDPAIVGSPLLSTFSAQSPSISDGDITSTEKQKHRTNNHKQCGNIFSISPYIFYVCIPCALFFYISKDLKIKRQFF